MILSSCSTDSRESGLSFNAQHQAIWARGRLAASQRTSRFPVNVDVCFQCCALTASRLRRRLAFRPFRTRLRKFGVNRASRLTADLTSSRFGISDAPSPPRASATVRFGEAAPFVSARRARQLQLRCRSSSLGAQACFRGKVRSLRSAAPSGLRRALLLCRRGVVLRATDIAAQLLRGQVTKPVRSERSSRVVHLILLLCPVPRATPPSRA